MPSAICYSPVLDQNSSGLFSLRSTAALNHRNPFFKTSNISLENFLRAAEEVAFDKLQVKEEVDSAILGERLISNGLPTLGSTRCMSLPLSMTSALLSPISLSTLASPKASANYESVTGRKTFKILKIVEELIESEQHYIWSLGLLHEHYIEPLLAVNNHKIGVPLILIEAYINILKDNHGSFLSEVEAIYYTDCAGTPLEFESDGKLLSTLQIAKDVSDLIVQHSTSSYIYEQYCLINNQILKLMSKSETKYNYFGNYENIKSGCQLFTESVQDEQHHMDLSFISLFQKPIARISKYKLILEALIAHVSAITNAEIELKHAMYDNLNCVKEKLNEVNYNINRQHDLVEKFEILFDRLNSSSLNQAIIKDYFKNDKLFDSFSFEIFGNPVLCGGLALLTMSRAEMVTCNYYGCILFKSHVFVLESRHHQADKFDIKFMIPLYCCKLSDDSEGLKVVGNTFSTFKIIFEFRFQLFELIFLSSSQEENNIWVNFLEILIYNVNGPYNFDYSLSKEKNLIHVPENLTPFDISLDKKGRKLGTFKTKFNDCYFRQLICVHVREQGESSSENYYSEFEHLEQITLRTKDKVEIRKRFGDIWSDELLSLKPSVLIENETRDSSCDIELGTDQSIELKRGGSLLRKASIAFSSMLSRKTIVD